LPPGPRTEWLLLGDPAATTCGQWPGADPWRQPHKRRRPRRQAPQTAGAGWISLMSCKYQAVGL